ncbi:hypothetical protein [Haloferula sargassicola]|uniref:SGNH hydrolase-type esterase domain-containing protein n=1 Tax=Haloferula sargassicola TaxID=490096 RepID=A0ABP9UK89_9BACT
MTDLPPLSDELRAEIEGLANDLDAFRTRRPRATPTGQLEDRRHALLARHTSRPPTEKLTCIGDSNTMFFAGAEHLRFIRYRRSGLWKPNWINRGLDLLPCFRVFHVGPATAWKAGDHGSSTRSREKLEILLKKDVAKGSKVLISFGEIDCRIHMARAIQAGKDLHEAVAATATKFVELPAWIASQGFEPVIWGPPQIIPKDEKLSSPTFPFVGPWELRRDITYAFIDALDRECSTRGFPMIAIAGLYHPREAKADLSFFHDGVHLSQRLMPLALSALHEAGVF